SGWVSARAHPEKSRSAFAPHRRSRPHAWLCSADKSCGLDIPRTPLVSRRWRRQLDREPGAFAGLGVDPDRAAVLLDDALHDAEAETGPGLALRREEGLPDALEVLGRDAAAVVLDDEPGAPALRVEPEADRPAFFRRLDRVADEIQRNLQDFLVIDDRGRFGVPGPPHDVAELQRRLEAQDR